MEIKETESRNMTKTHTLSELWAINTHHLYSLLIKPHKHFAFIAVAEERSDTRRPLADGISKAVRFNEGSSGVQFIYICNR